MEDGRWKMVCTADTAVVDASTYRVERVGSMEEIHENATRCRRTAKAKANTDYKKIGKGREGWEELEMREMCFGRIKRFDTGGLPGSDLHPVRKVSAEATEEAQCMESWQQVHGRETSGQRIVQRSWWVKPVAVRDSVLKWLHHLHMEDVSIQAEGRRYKRSVPR